MSAAGLAGVTRRKFVPTTVKGSGRQAPDLVDRNLTAAPRCEAGIGARPLPGLMSQNVVVRETAMGHQTEKDDSGLLIATAARARCGWRPRPPIVRIASSTPSGLTVPRVALPAVLAAP